MMKEMMKAMTKEGDDEGDDSAFDESGDIEGFTNQMGHVNGMTGMKKVLSFRPFSYEVFSMPAYSIFRLIQTLLNLLEILKRV